LCSASWCFLNIISSIKAVPTDLLPMFCILCITKKKIFFGGGVVLGLELEFRALSLQSSHSTIWVPPDQFALVILERGVSWTICPSWPQSGILLISASQVVRTTVMSHQHKVVSLNAYKLLLANSTVFPEFI
jgi:hypothetical protein